MPRKDLESIAIGAADHLGQEAHILGWLVRDNGEGLVLVYLDGTWTELGRYRDQVAFEVAEALELLEEGLESI